jgi:hypothetical protein
VHDLAEAVHSGVHDQSGACVRRKQHPHVSCKGKQGDEDNGCLREAELDCAESSFSSIAATPRPEEAASDA